MTPIQAPETQSTFYRRAQRNAFRPRDALSNAKFFSRSHDAVIRVYDEAGNVIETHEQTGEFKAW